MVPEASHCWGTPVDGLHCLSPRLQDPVQPAVALQT